MAEESEKKQPKRTTGYLFIAVGILGIISYASGTSHSSIVSFLKVVIPIAAIGFGLFILIKRK